MERKIITTLDGSTTIQLVDWNECYHSKMGAIQEAYHVFIKNGLDFFENQSISILEIGLGTGLNAFITFLESERKKQYIKYEGVEAYPINIDEVQKMNYCSALNEESKIPIFEKIHISEWNKEIDLSERFSLKKRKQFFHEIEDTNRFDLIYFDAFGYQVQPDLWTEEIFHKMYKALKDKGVLVTYAARGVVKRAMKSVGFEVVKVPGPPGKREMMIGFKKN
ncbi:tRNA (5-methylaminomethyl-2-thiouridine)(34)-methyltransferase MnmD [Flavobacterium columnare]|uniref:tRNA (5-methylaminomethyl-2-thiouridine)(34)-methyltransferase MnmD n=1 Tax=Flavobacterium columnare TaxID=996 RepID=A0AAI8GAC8_9FLAO|nr:tRNA (5-methylaminomethyl-2-thiouridine)(34)-methyltransferase MnmD [Flavobacterium columnare]AMO19296.1 tRNA (5-methylaminomethyl-2-thiouridine)(34)-methyltransferase MnmD [Flavobacterium columnare]APT21217.1 SAM-dependent methyltransferase [Flavobacterium columnare]AUX17231.1 SAM-dependent methyltransferase [Flavobacterium columnare]MEB3800069.1 tRNA (5-methylaminomethyl-2-thiouridine)(34)-methyltransferase MnmD [Flavobacterium columnare]QOG56241.1 tRNA (5-methylaminomethyl-2-thiouridine)